MLHSNLGGQGPDASAPPSIRYVNVASGYSAQSGPFNVDLEVTAMSEYTPQNASLNGLVGSLARINLACNHHVNLRVQTVTSCATLQSCKACLNLSPAARSTCFSTGCSCYGETVYNEAACTGQNARTHQVNYACTQMNSPLSLPQGSLVTVSVLDFDTGERGDYLEQLTVPTYAYFKTPLRPVSDNAIRSTVYVNERTRTFTSTAPSSNERNGVINLNRLLDSEASRGVQFFFEAEQGYIDATFRVSPSGGWDCTGTGRDLLFSGDSSLCAPPPPPPFEPPSVPPWPPSLPPPSPPSPPPPFPPPSPSPFPPLVGVTNEITDGEDEQGLDGWTWPIIVVAGVGLLCCFTCAVSSVLFHLATGTILHVAIMNDLHVPDYLVDDTLETLVKMQGKEASLPATEVSLRGVTGMVYFEPKSKKMILVVEGRRRAVNSLINSINADDRFIDVSVLSKRHSWWRTGSTSFDEHEPRGPDQGVGLEYTSLDAIEKLRTEHCRRATLIGLLTPQTGRFAVRKDVSKDADYYASISASLHVSADASHI